MKRQISFLNLFLSFFCKLYHVKNILYKVFIASVLLCCVFLLSGGLSLAYVLVNGSGSVLVARFALTAPFFGLFVLVGLFGLLMAYKKAGMREGVYGLVISGACFLFIEVLYNTVLG